jgi:hypothetical protein
MRVKANAAGVWRRARPPDVKHAFEIGATPKTANINRFPPATARPRFRAGAASKTPEDAVSLPRGFGTAALLGLDTSRLLRGRGIMTAEGLLAGNARLRIRFALPRCWRTGAGGFLIALALAAAFVAPAAATTPPGGALNSTDAVLKWINAYRGKPEPEALPVLVRGLSEMQAFKDPESCGAYIGFIAGVLGANPERAAPLIERMLAIQPAHHWVLVRAIAYSGLPNWKVLLLKYADRMRTRSGMIDKYVDGKLPTLDQIDYQNARPGMIDKIKVAFSFGVVPKKAVVLEPSPELIDVLWGYYLATGSYPPIGRIIRFLPLANDKDNVDSLTAGSAAKFTLASNAVRDLHLLEMLKRAAPSQPQDTAKILNDVIETAETVDTARMRKESLATIEELKQKGPNSKREMTSWGQVGQGALSMGCVVAAATGQVEIGIPCVIGGAAYSAGLQYMSH